MYKSVHNSDKYTFTVYLFSINFICWGHCRFRSNYCMSGLSIAWPVLVRLYTFGQIVACLQARQVTAGPGEGRWRELNTVKLRWILGSWHVLTHTLLHAPAIKTLVLFSQGVMYKMWAYICGKHKHHDDHWYLRGKTFWSDRVQQYSYIIQIWIQAHKIFTTYIF